MNKVFPYWWTERERGWDPTTQSRATIYERERQPSDRGKPTNTTAWAWTVVCHGCHRSGVSTTQAGARRACRQWVQAIPR